MTLKNPKAKGSRLERKAIAELEAIGYYCIKSGGGLGAFDVIAVPRKVRYARSEKCLAIQVKANKPPSPAETARIIAMDLPSYFVKELWVWKDYTRHWIKTNLSNESHWLGFIR